MHQINFIDAVGAQRCGNAVIGRIKRVDGNIEPAIDYRSCQGHHVSTEVAGNDCIGIRGNDFGDVGSKVLDLPDWVKFIAHDLNVRTFFPQQFNRRVRHHLPERIVLANDINLLNLGVHGNVIGQHIQLHHRMGVKSKMPEAALLIGQNRVNRGVVDLQNLLPGVPTVVSANGRVQRVGDCGTVTLKNNPQPFTYRASELNLGIRRTLLIVQRDNLNHATTENATLGVEEFICRVLQLLETTGADGSECARQRVDKRDPHRLLGRNRTEE